MGAQNVTLLRGATVAATGGTSQAFTPDGVSIDGGIHLADAGQTSFKLRSSIVLKTKNPQLVQGEYTKGKRWLTLMQPMVLTSGSVVQNVVRIEVEVHPDLASADVVDLCLAGSQLLFDDDLLSFLNTGSLA